MVILVDRDRAAAAFGKVDRKFRVIRDADPAVGDDVRVRKDDDLSGAIRQFGQHISPAG